MLRKIAIGAAAAALLGFAGVPAASAASTSTIYQTIDFHGYEIQVPASWPVYNLAADPTRCVLFDQHAVYLGTPGADQQCPTRAYGRTEAVLVQPEPTSVPSGSVELAANTASFSAALSSTEATGHTVQFTAPGPGVQVTATYGSDEAQIRSILAGARMTAKTSAKAPTVSAPAITSGKAAGTATGHAAAGGGTSKSLKSSKATKSSESSKATTNGTSAFGLSGEQGQGLGIDTCTVPSAATMRDWLASPYRVISTYLGGANWACTYGDFTDDWVGRVAAEGWQFIPIWVGPQAPCTQLTNTTVVDPSTAEAEGESEAAGAVAAAQEFGYGAGTPIYYDMESYDNSNTSCSQAVLTFLSGWTAGLHSAGYLSGVYSSAATGISDLVGQYSTTGTGYQSPDDVWFADWNTDPVLTNPYLPTADWQGAKMHQYYGDHDETWGGVTLTVDSDVVDAAVAGYPGTAATGQPTVTDEPAAVSVPSGSDGTAQLQIQGGGQASVVSWHADPPPGVSVWPASGTAVVSGDGQVCIRLKVSTDGTPASGRYDVPITASANGRQITETFLLVSSASAVASPVVLYAADSQSMTIAENEALQLALPAGNVTGDFAAAWTDLTSGSDLVITVGDAAGNALWHNGCGWTNPSGTTSGTPFGFDDVPLTSGSSSDFEAALGSTTASVDAAVAQYAQFGMAGTVPNDSAAQTLGSDTPGDTCLGSPDVPVQ